MKWYKKYLDLYGLKRNEVCMNQLRTISELLKKKSSDTPLASVVLIAHNEEAHILSCIWSLCNNICTDEIEIIVVNNNSIDGTEELLKEIGANYFNETQKGPGHARQCGLDHAKGKYYICIDADTIYPPHYIRTHLKELKKKDIIATYSLWSFIPDDTHSKFSLFCYEGMRDVYLYLQSLKRPELCVRGMTFAFQTEAARRYGFRTDIKRGEDGYLALQLKAAGKLRFIKTRKARPITGYGTVGADGSLLNSFKIRSLKAIKNIGNLFTRKKEYKDEDSNLL